MDEHEHFDNVSEHKSEKSSIMDRSLNDVSEQKSERSSRLDRPFDAISEQKSERSERSRPSTPKWWRPSYPPETYLWEEIRRQRQRGGYPWTLLDKEEVDDGDLEFRDHLYEPVNPPPLYGSGYMDKDHDTASLDGRLLDIPPDMDIVSSEGLDGLDQPDPHDMFGIDGDKEWHLHADEEKGFSSMKTVFTAGIRKRNLPKHGETSSVRPLTNKDAGQQVEGAEVEQVVPDNVTTPEPEASSSTKPSALDQLRSKAGQVKQRISKISLPTRPKFKNWSGMKLMKRKKPKDGDVVAVDMEDVEQFEQRVPEPEEIIETHSIMKTHESIPGRTTPLTIPTEHKQISFTEEVMGTSEFQGEAPDAKAKKDKEDEELKSAKAKEQAEKQEQERLKKEAEILKREETDRIKAEEKLQKELAQEEQKKFKQEAKLQKEKAQEEQKKAKAEEKAAKERAAEEQKRLKAEEKILKEQQEEELKKTKLEEKALKEQEEEELKRVKQEEKLLKDLHEEELKKMKLEVEVEKKQVDEPRGTKSVDDRIKALEQFEYDMESEIQISPPEDKPQTPTPKKPTTTEIIKRKLADIDLKKRFKRSKTPPPRPEQPKFKFTRRGKDGDGLENQLATQYKKEIGDRNVEMEAEQRVPEPQIYVTQPSVDSETHGEWIPPSHQRGQTETTLAEDEEEDVDGTQKEKFGDKIKGFGQKSKAIAAQTSKGLGKKMKVIGKDIKQFGGKVNVKCKETIKEIRATQEAARQRSRRDKENERVDEDETPEQPRQTFRFKKRPPPEVDESAKQNKDNDAPVIVGSQKKGPRPVPSHYENTEVEDKPGTSESTRKETKVHRSQVLGRAERDWESPLDISRSRGASEEPNFSGNISSGWETPPGSSIASSSVQPPRRAGVLEEIDSDEFFLRERGISEGEDEEEMNRLLVEELRQAFRPAHTNALTGFDLPTPPERPTRVPRKAPRKSTEKKASPSFQTFPPERPKRKHTAGYISSYMEANGGNSFDDDQQPPAFAEDEDDADLELSEEDKDEGIRRVKEELRKIDQDMEDDGRYEPVSDSPQRPQRSKKRKPKPKPPSPTILYYNTIAANTEWMNDIEDQMITDELELNLVDEPPVPPKRRLGRSASGSRAEGSEIHFADEDVPEVEDSPRKAHASEPPLAQAESAGQFEDLDDLLDLMDESGYAVVQKDAQGPTTVPRRKRRGKGTSNANKRHSLKRRSQEGDGGPAFFSLPRYTPRTFHIVPPSRPQRNYSTLRPKRPPRQKSKSSQNLKRGQDPERTLRREPVPDAATEENKDKDSRPSTAIGIMSGRPLPPPPRPDRSPVPPQNDLDQASLERMVGVRHYANFDDDEEDGPNHRAVVEEICVAKNITLLGQEDGDESFVGSSDVNIGIQTDPLREEDFDLNTVGSFEEEEDRIQRLRDSIQRVSSDDREQDPIISREDPYPPAIPARSSIPSREIPGSYPPMQVIFPTRLHLNELEVDFLRVNELSAHALTMDRLETRHLQVSSLSSTGPLSVPLIQAPNLTADHLHTERFSSSSSDIPSMSIPPPSFYQLTSPSQNPYQETEERSDSTMSTEQGQRQSHLEQPRVDLLPRPRPSSPDPECEDVMSLSMRLGRALLRVGMRTIESMVNYIDSATSNDPDCQQQQRVSLQVMLCLLLLLVTGIFLMTRSGTVPPRWEFYLPPPDL